MLRVLMKVGLLPLALLSVCVAAPAAAEDTLAFPHVTGVSRGGPKKFESGVRRALRKAKVDFVDGEDLGEVEGAGTDIMAARDMDADHLLRVRIARAKKKFLATVTLVSTQNGEIVWRTKRSYKTKKRAWKAGKTVGWLVVRQLQKLRAAPQRPVVAAKPKKTSTAVIKDEAETAPKEGQKAVASVSRASTERHSDDKLFRVSLGGGSQLSGAYTVSVGGQVTGLAYELRPTGLIAGTVLVNVPSTPVSAEVALAYVPMFYDIDVEPGITPDQPGARHLDVSGSLGYGFKLSLVAEDNVELRPLVGLTYRSLAVQAQEPINVLIGHASIAPHFGGRAGLRIGDLTMEAHGLLRVIVSYRESPATTGEGGSGFSFLVGAGARYWITDYLGAYVNVAYDFTRVGFSGEGTRVSFKDDPALSGASLYAEEIRTALGVTAAF